MEITPLDYNELVTKNASQTFGMVMYTPGSFQVTDISLTGTLKYDRHYTSFFYFLVVIALIWFIALTVYIAIQIRSKMYKKRQEHDSLIIQQALNTFVNFVDAKDSYTKGHSTRVAIYSAELARRLRMSVEDQENMYYVALMHDVGKIGIPDIVLKKPGKLTPEERTIIEGHTTAGGEMLRDFTAIPGTREGALYHHERYDGGGYPQGLSGMNIPLFARIICIADSYDAMSSNRCYRPHLPKEKILSELYANAGTQFDPNIVEHMIDMINDGFTDYVIYDTLKTDLHLE